MIRECDSRPLRMLRAQQRARRWREIRIVLGGTIVSLLCLTALLMSGCALPSAPSLPGVDGACGHREKFVPSMDWETRLSPDEKRQAIKINQDIDADCGGGK